jgi:His/Glu/Gln/Arg/opine family amino acid ABC transporter permease subunit
MSDQLDFLIRQLPNLLWGFPGKRPGGLLLSILLSGGAIAVGLALAIALAFARHSRHKWISFPADRIVWAIRGIPLIVLLVLLFQFLGTGALLGIEFSAFWSAAITLTLYAAAYLADVVTAGIAAVPEQLREDARILGASRSVVARTVTLPYVMRTMRPALVTQAVTVFKDSSVVVVLGVSDLTTNARIALGGDVTNAPFWVATYLMVGLLYWCVAFALSRAARHDRSPWQRSVRSAHA